MSILMKNSWIWIVYYTILQTSSLSLMPVWYLLLQRAAETELLTRYPYGGDLSLSLSPPCVQVYRLVSSKIFFLKWSVHCRYLCNSSLSIDLVTCFFDIITQIQRLACFTIILNWEDSTKSSLLHNWKFKMQKCLFWIEFWFYWNISMEFDFLVKRHCASMQSRECALNLIESSSCFQEWFWGLVLYMELVVLGA